MHNASEREKCDVVCCKTLILPKSNFFTCPEKVKMWPKVVKSDMVRFRTPQTSHSSLLRSLLQIGDKQARGCPPPPSCVVYHGEIAGAARINIPGKSSWKSHFREDFTDVTFYRPTQLPSCQCQIIENGCKMDELVFTALWLVSYIKSVPLETPSQHLTVWSG